MNIGNFFDFVIISWGRDLRRSVLKDLREID